MEDLNDKINNNNYESINNDTVSKKSTKFRYYVISFILGVVFCAVLLIAIGLISEEADNNTSVSQDTLNKSQRIMKTIDKYYLEKYDKQNLQESLLKGLVSGLNDPYSQYYTSSEAKELLEMTDGTISGIGAVFTQNSDKYIQVVETVKDSPAEKAGILKDDILTKVNGKSIDGMTLEDIVSLIKGKEGTKVKITMYRDSKEIDFEIKRKKIVVDSVKSEIIKNNIGYISISQFSETTIKQFKTALDHLKAKKVKGLIIDIRNNPGGVITSCTEILDQLLPKGLLVYIKDKNGQRQDYKSTDKNSCDLPIVVLVNENSASASEIFAGALQDRSKATILGTTTYGKGIVQQIISLEDGTYLKLTIAQYYTPNGRSIHKKGIKPDIEVKANDKGEDNQLDAAIKEINKKIK